MLFANNEDGGKELFNSIRIQWAKVLIEWNVL